MVLRWARAGDVLPLARLLAATFAPGSSMAPWRFGLKVLVTPHLTTGPPYAVVGLSPVLDGSWAPRRVATALAWVACGRGRRFDVTRPPRPLARAGRWRACNLAAAPDAPAARVVALARTVMALADRLAVEVELLAADDPRLVQAYERHGFVTRRSVPGLHRRAPRSPDRPPCR